jgi:glycosyltransferase involved in cell wall biosynthesis/tetratricopeptide (TPR) repeat protein
MLQEEDSMRYLYGPTSERFVQENLKRHCLAGECRPFDAQGATGLKIGVEDTWEAVLARLPTDWRPEFVALDLHYTLVPPCLWMAPVPVVGLAADWNLLWHGYRGVLPSLDLVLTDTAGVRAMEKEGIWWVWQANLFGLESGWEEMQSVQKGTVPWAREGRPPFEDTEADRDIDILFVGNLHPAVQRERLPWLARVARLADRRRVSILQGVQGEEYRRLLGRTRIAFNRSIRGECNLRVFEAVAAGALLFQEAENLEVPAYFRDRQECVYYTSENLEELLEYYLDHEDERRAIALAAGERVGQYTFENLWAEQVQRIEREWPSLQERARQRQTTNHTNYTNTAAVLPARVWQALSNSTPARDTRLVRDLVEALVTEPRSAELHNALGLAIALDGQRGPQAAGQFRRAVECNPGHLVAGLNLAEALAAAGDRSAAIEQARRTLERCQDYPCDPGNPWLDAPHYPPAFDFFRVEWERAAWAHAGDRAAEAREKKTLLRWRLHHLLGDLTGDVGHYEQAIAGRSDLPTTRAALGCALARAGQLPDAIPHLQDALRDNPFDLNAARALYQVLGTSGDRAAQQSLARERELLARAAPRSVPVELWFAAEQNAPSSRNGHLAVSRNESRPVATEPGGRMAVVWEGDFEQIHSLALVNREVTRRLRGHGHLVAQTASGHHQTAEEIAHWAQLHRAEFQELGRSADVHVRHQWPPRWQSPPAGHWVVMQHWEFGSLPCAWIEPLSRQVDEIWVASTWVRNCFIRSSLPEELVQVVPLGVDAEQFHPGARPLELRSRKRFKFLFVGGTVSRKGIDVLLDVYTRTFTASDDVCLVIKDMGVGTFYQGMTAEERIAALQAQANAPEIEYIDRTLAPEELAGLYTACNCLVQPYRGEGFGLPIAEAMASGLPVIVTGYGAALDFCSEENAYLIPAQLVRFSEKKLHTEPTVDYPWLAEPDREALQKLLQRVIAHPGEAGVKAALGRETIRTRFTWDHTAAVVERRLQTIRRQPLRRTQDVNTQRPVVRRQQGSDHGLLTADCAKPVSVCLIVKNEEKNLPSCLESVRGLANEVIVVDTGSTDRTREIAVRYGAKVFDFVWVKSFAAARNATLDHATGDWIFWIDADDRIDEPNRRKLRELFGGLGDDNAAWVMKCICVPDRDTGTTTLVEHVRLFRHDSKIRWTHRVHEQILPAVRAVGGEPRFVNIEIQHIGYQDPALRLYKRERDLELLLLEYAEQPDHPFTLFNLGMTYLDLRHPAEAMPLLERSLAGSAPADSIVRKLHYMIVQCHRQLGQRAEALAACQRGRSFYGQDEELLSQEGQLRDELGDFTGAEACYLQLLTSEEGPHFASVPLGLHGYRTRHNLGVLYCRQGRVAEAEVQWRAALAEQPGFMPSRLALEEVTSH